MRTFRFSTDVGDALPRVANQFECRVNLTRIPHRGVCFLPKGDIILVTELENNEHDERVNEAFRNAYQEVTGNETTDSAHVS